MLYCFCCTTLGIIIIIYMYICVCVYISPPSWVFLPLLLFRAVVGSQQNWEDNAEISHRPPVSTHGQPPTLSTSPHPRQLGTFVNNWWTYINTSSTLSKVHSLHQGLLLVCSASHISSTPPAPAPNQLGTFVTIDEPTPTHLQHPKSIVNIRVHSWCCVFCMFGQVYDDMYPP